MSNQFLQRRRWLYVIATTAGLIIMVAAGLVVQTATPRTSGK